MTLIDRIAVRRRAQMDRAAKRRADAYLKLVISSDGVIRIPPQKKWTSSCRMCEGMIYTQQRETAPWLWRLWRALRWGEDWALNYWYGKTP